MLSVIAAELAETCRPWLPAGAAPVPSVTELVTALRTAEDQTGGPERDLWAHAAANAAAATKACNTTPRELWATALDYARRAQDAGSVAALSLGKS
ncbi:hypothetical protein GCM10010289_84460 [Streptomyces violascens]|nr:hypothetical protein GCM10010289_84460 [Streptomyces violascens]